MEAGMVYRDDAEPIPLEGCLGRHPRKRMAVVTNGFLFCVTLLSFFLGWKLAALWCPRGTASKVETVAAGATGATGSTAAAATAENATGSTAAAAAGAATTENAKAKDGLFYSTQFDCFLTKQGKRICLFCTGGAYYYNSISGRIEF